MTVTTVNALWSKTPEVTPLSGGLLSHVTLVEDIAWQNPKGMGLSYNCLDTGVPTELCDDTPANKQFNPPSVIEGIEFAVYGGLSCKPFGFSEEVGKEEINRVFSLKESRGVERALMETRFIDGPDDDPAPDDDPDPGDGIDLRWDAATDITPAGGAVSPQVALALLEGYSGSAYAGQPTLHIPYTVGSYLAAQQSLVSVGGKFYTELGAKAAVGAGYQFPNNGPDGTQSDPGKFWMYATGEVLVARSKIVNRSIIDRNTNDIYALAERRYIAAIDCFAAAILVSVE